MKHSLTRVSTFALIGMAILAQPAKANTIQVSTCSTAGNPGTAALHIIDGASRYIIPSGQNGLTDSIIYNRARSLEWLVSSELFPAGTNFGGSDDLTCGIQTEDQPPAAPAPAQSQEQAPVQQPAQNLPPPPEQPGLD